MYVVRFVRKDNFPNEEYFYPQLSDAYYHFQLFENDTSQLYCVLQLLEIDTKRDSIIHQKVFDFTGEELAAIREYGTSDQFDTMLLFSLLAKCNYDENSKSVFTSAKLNIASLSAEKYPEFYRIVKKQRN